MLFYHCIITLKLTWINDDYNRNQENHINDNLSSSFGNYFLFFYFTFGPMAMMRGYEHMKTINCVLDFKSSEILNMVSLDPIFSARWEGWITLSNTVIPYYFSNTFWSMTLELLQLFQNGINMGFNKCLVEVQMQ